MIRLKMEVGNKVTRRITTEDRSCWRWVQEERSMILDSGEMGDHREAVVGNDKGSGKGTQSAGLKRPAAEFMRRGDRLAKDGN